jgi:hypothetical protein
MEERSVKTSASPEVTIEEVGGSLLVKGWEENEVRARSDSGDGLAVEEEQDSLSIRCQGDLTVRLPAGATLRIGTVYGDTRVKLLEDSLSIGQVYGTLTLRDLGPVNAGTVRGDLQAREIAGDLRVETIQGMASIREVQGEFFADRIQGDLALRDVKGNIRAAVDGTVKLRLSNLSGERYEIEANGDLHAIIPEEASAQIHLSSNGQTLVLDLPGQHVTLEQGEHNLTLGDGRAQLDLSAGGILTLTGREVEWSGPEGFGEDFPGLSPDFTEQLTRQIEDQVQAQMARLSEQMARLSEMMGRAGLSEEEAEQVMRQAQRSAEEATARAQEKIARAQERMARKMEAASRKAEQRARAAERRREGGRGGWSFVWPAPPQPPVPPSPPGEVNEPVSDEERLLILRMLEQKKISLEEAEKLLAALEEKGT